SLELYEQANARLDRQGQKNPVVIHHLVTPGTVDERIMEALENKGSVQDALMQYLTSCKVRGRVGICQQRKSTHWPSTKRPLRKQATIEKVLARFCPRSLHSLSGERSTRWMPTPL